MKTNNIQYCVLAVVLFISLAFNGHMADLRAKKWEDAYNKANTDFYSCIAQKQISALNFDQVIMLAQHAADQYVACRVGK